MAKDMDGDGNELETGQEPEVGSVRCFADCRLRLLPKLRTPPLAIN